MDNVCHNVRKGPSDTGGRNTFQRRPTLPEAIISSTISSRTITRKKSFNSVQISMRPSKRSCSDSPVKQDANQRRNRVHRRLIMRDIGKGIYEASSLRAVLTGLLGGIRGE